MNPIRKFLYWSLCENRWSWFHTLAGGVLAKLFIRFTSPGISVLLVLLVAILWEIFEMRVDNIEIVYGSKERWAYDSLGDIVLAVLCAVLVVV